MALFAFAVPSHAYRMSAWVPSWDPAALEVMRVQAGNLQETNPGWYTIAAGGTFTTNYKADDPDMRAALAGTQLVPTIKNYVNGKFDGALVATIVSDPALREKHAETLTQLVIDRGFDGIDIDYESVPTTARANFTAFITLLAGKLHDSRRMLSVTVHAKTTDTTRNGPGAQDWAALGAVADSVKIMAYDKHWSTSEAGAISPLDWLDEVATYAESTIPEGKAIIGLPWYGYDWLGTSGKSVTFAQATATAQTAGVTVSHDVNGEATYTYDGRTVFFQDAASYRAKIDMITKKHPRIAGFAHWRVGSEDPAIWPIVRELTMQSSGSAPATPSTKTFAIDAPSTLSVTAGKQVMATLRYTAIDGFDSIVNTTAAKVDAFDAAVFLTSPTVTRNSATHLLVSVPLTAPSGTYRLKVTMTGGGVTREQVLTLNVTSPLPSRRRAVR